MAEVAPSNFAKPVEDGEKCEDEDAWVAKIRQQLADDTDVGPELAAKIEDVDLRRICRGYSTEADRAGATFVKAKLWATDAVNTGTLDSWEKDLPEDEFNEIKAILPMYSHGVDKQGHPVVYEKVCKYNLEKINPIIKAGGAEKDEMMRKVNNYRDRIVAAEYQFGLQRSKRDKVTAYKKVLVIDAYNVGISRANACMDLVKLTVNRESDLFAETIYKIYIINSGWTFRAVWSVVSLFVHKLTAAKVNIVGSAYISDLKKEIDVEQIPTEFGGKSTVEPKVGGWWYPVELVKSAATNVSADS